MPQSMRLLLYPAAIILIIYSLAVSNYYLTFTGAAILLFAAFFFSHRKQRIRYWFQGYATNYLRQKDEQAALEETRREFCQSKYANKDICEGEYTNIKELIRDIIKVEYKFKKLLEHNGSLSDLKAGMSQYASAMSKLDKEIEEVANEKL